MFKMSFNLKVQWIDSIWEKYENFDAVSLFYEEIGPILREIKEEMAETDSVLKWFAQNKTNDAKYADTLVSTTRLKEFLEMILDDINDWKEHLESIKQKLEDEDESDEDYFDRTYGRRPGMDSEE